MLRSSFIKKLTKQSYLTSMWNPRKLSWRKSSRLTSEVSQSETWKWVRSRKERLQCFMLPKIIKSLQARNNRWWWIPKTQRKFRKLESQLLDRLWRSTLMMRVPRPKLYMWSWGQKRMARWSRYLKLKRRTWKSSWRMFSRTSLRMRRALEIRRLLN